MQKNTPIWSLSGCVPVYNTYNIYFYSLQSECMRVYNYRIENTPNLSMNQWLEKIEYANANKY